MWRWILVQLIWISCWKLCLSFASWVIAQITILGYTFQSRKLEKLINTHQNIKSLTRKSLTSLEKQLPKVFYRNTALEIFPIFRVQHLCWSLLLIKLQTFMPATLLRKDSNTDAVNACFCRLKHFVRIFSILAISMLHLAY